MTFLVAHAPLHGRVDAEHVADGRAQRLGAVEHDQDALVDVEAALDEVGQQGCRDGGVLRGAVPQAERVLDAVGTERDHAAAALELDPVEHQHRQAQVLQRA
jgi:hypothetical protein